MILNYYNVTSNNNFTNGKYFVLQIFEILAYTFVVYVTTINVKFIGFFSFFFREILFIQVWKDSTECFHIPFSSLSECMYACILQYHKSIIYIYVMR